MDFSHVLHQLRITQKVTGSYLLPIFTIGKFIEQGEKTFMPLALQVHHSVCDGFHTGRFVNALQTLEDNYDEWLYT
jgi:chloramphenicol O-acetyltransferase type A